MLSPDDIPGFFANPSELNPEDYVTFKYLFETDEDPRLAAASLCCEQSTAQWKRPGVQEDLRPLYGARVVALKKCEELGVRGEELKILSSPHPSLLTPHRYEVTIAHPHRNFGPKIPNLLSVAAGEGPFYCPGIQKIKWIDVEFPNEFLKHFQGPQFGVRGVRDQLKVYDRPLFVGVVKPNIGLSPVDFAALAYQAWVGGLDIAKDDEMLGDVEWSSLSERTREVGPARAKAEKATGEKKIYMASITDEVDRLIELHDLAVRNGTNCVMINGIMMGLSAVRVLRKHSQVPMMSHFTGTACFSRLPDFGISSLVTTKLQRLAGADIIGLAGFGERMKCSDEEVLDNIRACLVPWGNILPSLPVPGGSDWAGTLPGVFEKVGHIDFGFISGRGIFGHPQGPAAGAKSLQEAWEATHQNISLEVFAEQGHESLRMALAAFGKVSSP
jgi:ribulose-bisphosphate carboxylase large chain